MAQPGWYPDPTAPQGRRYWDGQRWLEDQPAPKRNGPLIWVLIGLLVVGALIAALIFLPKGVLPFAATPEDTRTARPTGTQWNELVPTETPSPTPIQSGFGAPIDCPYSGEYPRSELVDGRISGGGLSFEMPTGTEWRTSPAYVDWMYDSNSVVRTIAEDPSNLSSWISNVGVGYIKVSDGFSATPSSAAEQFVTCMASSGMFEGFSKRDILNDERYEVSGRSGWRLTSNVFVNNRAHLGIEGDVVDIIVVPTDDSDKLAVYVSCVTINHAENAAEVEHSLKTLRFDG